jgi:hypothetical protein
MEKQRGNFYLNEYPEECDHLQFIDIDANIPDDLLENVIIALKDLTTGAEILVLRNTISEKVHLIMNVPASSSRSTVRKMAISRWLASFLFEVANVGYFGYTKELWCEKIFDAKAAGIRSALSVKVSKGKIEPNKGVYAPPNVDVSRLSREKKLDMVVKYSIYNEPGASWTDVALMCFDEAERIFEIEETARKAADAIDEYDAERRMIEVRGTDYPVDCELLDDFIRLLPPWFAKSGKWGKVLVRVKAAALLVDDWNPHYFLHEWSAQDNSYDEEGNNHQYNSCKADPSKAGAALTWLRDRAYYTLKTEKLTKAEKYALRRQRFGKTVDAHGFNPCGPIPAEFSVEQYCEPDLRQFSFHGSKYDTLLIKSNMGTGKTKQLVEYIKDVPQEIYIIFVSFRRSFTTEIRKKLGASFVDYREVQDKKIIASRVVIQFESLHRLELPIGKRTLLVLDESESIIGQMENRQMITAGTLRSCWEHFQWLVTNATKMVAMDAFADYRTYALLRETRKSVHMHYNTYAKTQDVPQDTMYFEHTVFLKKVYEAAKTARESPFVVISTSKKQADAMRTAIHIRCPKANIKSYTSDSTAEERKDFEDVNTAWKDVDVLIYTSTISAGCSFEERRFGKVFAYFSDHSVDYKTAIQMLGRVRNIESREYHIFIRHRPSDLPNTVKEVERALAQKAEVADIVSNPLDMPKMINMTGEKKYVLKDLYYHLHVGNVTHRCQSRNNFVKLFCQHRAMMGVKVYTDLGDLEKEEAKGIRGENKETVALQALDTNERIAAAPVLTDEQAKALQNTHDHNSLEEKHALTAHNLVEFYHIPRERLTPKFVAKYNDPRAIRIYKNLNQLAHSDKSITDAVTQWRQARNAGLELAKKARVKTPNSMDELAQNDNLIRCMFAVDMINTLMDAPDETGTTPPKYCGANRHFGVGVTRVSLEKNVDRAIADIRKYADMVSLVFGIRKNRLMQGRAELKTKLKLVNSILESAFGVGIVALENKGARNTFQLSQPKLFQWDEDLERYTVKPEEKTVPKTSAVVVLVGDASGAVD